MFDAHCTECNKRMLIFPGQIKRMVNDQNGIVVFYQCWCGALNAWRTGSATQTERQLALAS
ncbi:MAG: hypothetical protein ACRDVZ_02925 [Jiangellaceae bacterium]